MKEVKIIEWIGYDAGAITCNSIANKRRTAGGNIKVTDHNGDIYDVHPLVYSCGGYGLQTIESEVGVYPIRWKEIAF